MLFLSFLNPDPEDGDPMEIGGRPSAPHAMEEKKGASKTRSVPPPTQDRTRNAVTWIRIRASFLVINYFISFAIALVMIETGDDHCPPICSRNCHQWPGLLCPPVSQTKLPHLSEVSSVLTVKLEPKKAFKKTKKHLHFTEHQNLWFKLLHFLLNYMLREIQNCVKLV